MLINLLLIMNLVISFVILYKKCVFGNKLEINHIFLFTMGFNFYLVVPIIVGNTGIFASYASMKTWYTLYKNIEKPVMIVYLLTIFIFYVCYTCSSEIICLFSHITLIQHIREKIKENKPGACSIDFKNINKKYLNIYLLMFILISVYFIFRFRHLFFRGYTNPVSYSLQKGPFVAVSIMIFSITLLYSLISKKQGNIISFRKTINNHFFYTYIIVGILIVSLGGRLYFLSAVMMLLVMRSVLFNKFHIKKIIYIFILLAFIMGIIGVLRLGSAGTVSLKLIIFNIFQETLYTSYSLISFLKAGRLELLNFPRFIVSDFINLIPSFILPDKLAYTLKPYEFGYKIYSPLGATNVYVTSLINFGILGSFLFFIVFGKILDYLKKRKTILSDTIYIMFSGFIAFTFFRDGADNSLIKNFFEFSLLIPILIYYSYYFFQKIYNIKYKSKWWLKYERIKKI